MAKKGVEPEFWIPPVFDQDGVQASSGIGVDGKEYGDPVPMAPPVGFTAPPDLMSMIRRMVQAEDIRKAQDAAGFETFEEADDFDIEDDPLDALTPYEKIFYPPEEVKPAVNGAPPASPPSVDQAAPQAPKVPEGAVSSLPPVSDPSKAQSST